MNTEAMTVCGWMAAVGLGSGGFYQGAFDKFISADAAGKQNRGSDGAMVDDGVSDGGASNSGVPNKACKAMRY